MAFILYKGKKIYIESISASQKLQSYAADYVHSFERSFERKRKRNRDCRAARSPDTWNVQKCQTSFSDAAKGPTVHYTEPRFRSAAWGCLVYLDGSKKVWDHRKRETAGKRSCKCRR